MIYRQRVMQQLFSTCWMRRSAVKHPGVKPFCHILLTPNTKDAYVGVHYIAEEKHSDLGSLFCAVLYFLLCHVYYMMLDSQHCILQGVL